MTDSVNDTISAIDRLKHTTEKQNKAANPNLSAWVSANAGSGKTYVLVKRVIRILLSGTLPHKILCLTFTKTAAAEMQNRLFNILSHWAVMDDHGLIKAIQTMAAVKLNVDDLGKARRLFAEALETPGGLKIQTIHAFCERILHTFPIEAGISPQFEVVDGRKAKEILNEIKHQTLLEAQNPHGRFGNGMAIISQYANEHKFDELLNNLIANRAKISKLIGYDFTNIELQSAPLGAAIGKLAHALNIAQYVMQADDKGLDIHDHYLQILANKTHWPIDALKSIAEILKQDGAKNNLKLANIIDAAIAEKNNNLAIDLYFDIFLTKARGAKSDKWISKKVKDNYTNLSEQLEAAKIEASQQYETLSAIKLYQASVALFEIGNDILWKFVQKKQLNSMVDYDDLINLTSHLLNGKSQFENGQTAWVLFKLDNGLDHILIDEAQDTSPEQWSVIEPLVKEITAGDGSRDDLRSLFVVGDEKQSIYKFQGANREVFKQKENSFETAFNHANMNWHHIPLDLSFRSAPSILEAVDRVFNFAQAASGVYDNAANNIKTEKITKRHFANRKAGAIVELWPIEQGLEIDIPDAWRAPVDEQSPISPSRMLADKIADKIKLWLDNKRCLKSTGNLVKPGDILVLVRRRNDFVNALIRALKRHNIPVAGIDRMRIGNEIIVEDMIALGKFCLFPEDELNLAILLKSPIFNLDDTALYQLSYGRKINLWQQILNSDTADWQEIAKQLQDFKKLSTQNRPFDFYMQILSRYNIREKLTARLGLDALDPLDEFLNLVENFELSNNADLNALLQWIKSDEEELKREIDQQKDEVRIMTVHGAKGLESNIVILPDTCGLPQKSRGEDLGFNFANINANESETIMQNIPNYNFAYWRPNKNIEPKLVKDIKANNYNKEIEEYHRLLYVAMTRAGDELYIAGYAKKPAVETAEFYNWYQMVEQAFNGWASVHQQADGTEILRYEAEGIAEHQAPHKNIEKLTQPLPIWASTPIKDKKIVQIAHAPSTLMSDDNLNITANNLRISPFNNINDQRYLRGNLIHKLLENLPKLETELQNAAMMRYLGKYINQFEPEILDDIASEVQKIMYDPIFSDIFTKESQSEVSIVGHIVHGTKTKLISGQIDRLIITNNEILILDYKSNRPPPTHADAISKQYLAQLAAYRALLTQTYPNHTIKSAILWTYTAQLMPISDHALNQVYGEIFN